MAALSANNPTLLDVAKLKDPNGGGILDIVEILNEVNPILDDMPFIEGNLDTGHKSAIRTGLPTPTWRKLYGGVQPTKGRTAPVTDSCGMLEAYAEVDKALADLNNNARAFRLTEDAAHIEGMSQELAATLMYGNSGSEPEAFTGLAPRYNSTSAENGGNIVNEGTTPDNSDNTSMWLIGWSYKTVFGIYPKGSMAGLQMEDKGQVTIEDADGSGGRMEAYRSHYRWDCGLVVKDWRYVVRIQFNQEDLVSDAATGPDLIDLMAQAIDLLPSTANCKPVFYGNRNARGYLRRQIMNKVAGSTLSIEQLTRPNGALIREPVFDGIPVRRCDALLNTEAGVA